MLKLQGLKVRQMVGRTTIKFAFAVFNHPVCGVFTGAEAGLRSRRAALSGQ
jgi:hypothetical protein